MNEHDHFSSVLDVEAIEESLDSHFDEGHSGMAADSDEAQAHEPQAPRKKPIPKALLLVGGMVAFVVLGAGYQHFFGAHPQYAASPGMTGSGTGGPDAGDTPLPSGTAITQQTPQGGMLTSGSAPPLPNQMQGQASEPIGPVPSQQSSRDLFANAAMPASTGAVPGAPRGAPSDVASRSGAIGVAPAAAAPTAPSPSPAPTFGNAAVPGSASLIQTSVEHGAPLGGLATGSTAPAVAESSLAMNAAPAPDPRDVEIAKLQAEVDALQRRDGVTGAGPAPVRAPVHRTAKHLSRGSRVAKEHSRSGASTNLIAGAHTSTDSSTADTSNGTQAAVADTTPSAGAPASAKSVARHAGKRHSARHAQHGKHPEAEVLAGYSIKQVIPGQGWIEDEQSGRQQVVAVGDVIGTAKVVRIDPDNYRIVTTAGVIQ
ncbi:hypothetical protein [Trinickia dinghuensis]|uniref:Uncharacterized protein n=1 Tax=Trinickia dinghuensis TaxID=2291023 RepID=A0A3D8K1G8_9BURK|nr:hypothetical protein [Trinickia dinghuensis]RDU98734.1 hypothetical protein DWV00_10725 [Trinickia dinghuensis]